jgi:ATP-dependent Clp protease ATP-binding subunit ClpA
VFERFTPDARQTVVQAQEEARRFGHQHIDTVHLLVALARQDEGPGARALGEHGLDTDGLRERVRRMIGPGGETLDGDALATIGIDLDEVRRAVEASFGTGALDRGRSGHRPFTKQAKKILELSLREAIALKHNHICSGHVLLGLLRAGGADNAALRVLADAGVEPAALRATATRLIQADAA